MAKNTVTFAPTTRYELSAGRKPSGFGSWAFEADFGDTSMMLWTPHSMSYADAKKNVKAQALVVAADNQYEGSIEIEVQP